MTVAARQASSPRVVSWIASATEILHALGSGGLTGLGLGDSRQKFFYVPGAHTDGIFAIIGEETGFIGAVTFMILYLFLLYRGFRIAMYAKDEFGAFLAVGITCWFGFQTFLNIGGVTHSIPLPPEKSSPKIKVLTVAPLLAEATKRIHHDPSISTLFDKTEQ